MICARIDFAERGIRLSRIAPQSFIIKIWLEETAEEAGRATWRGHITHVPSGQRQYIQNLDRIPWFIMPYLEAMGVEFGVLWRMTRRVKGLWYRPMSRS
jgi:hypothetical protein